MGFIHCCGALRRSVTYSLAPEDGFLIAEVDVLNICPACGNLVVQLTRINLDHEVSTIRKSNAQARKLFLNVRTSILYEQKNKYLPVTKSKFYLNYNEYGTKKRCYSNISTMTLGRFDSSESFVVTNPILISSNLKKSKQFTRLQPSNNKTF